MQKRGLIFAFTPIFLMTMINFVSAQFYGGFSLSDILNSIDSSTMILGIIFIVAFALLNFSLSKFFHDNKAIAGIIAFAISLGITWVVNRTGLNFEGFFYTLGFSEGFLVTIVSLALIGGGIYFGVRYGFGVVLTLLGGFFIILSFTNFIYETGTTFIIGLIFLGIGIWLLSKKKRGIGGSYQDYDVSSGPSSRQVYKQELAERRYNEKVRQSQIGARAKNIQEIRMVREKRNVPREQRGQRIDQRKAKEYAKARAEAEREERAKARAYGRDRKAAEKLNIKINKLLKDSNYLIKQYNEIKRTEPNNTKLLSQIQSMLKENQKKINKLKR